MTNNQKQDCVDLMADHLFQVFERFMDAKDYATADALYQEWNVDGQDPEDGEYEFMFINDLTEV